MLAALKLHFTIQFLWMIVHHCSSTLLTYKYLLTVDLPCKNVAIYIGGNDVQWDACFVIKPQNKIIPNIQTNEIENFT